MFVVFTAGNASALEIVGPSNSVYLDIAGNDATGTRGNAARPFLTVDAAFAAMQSGDVLIAGPGNFPASPAKTVQLPALATMMIRGYGELSGDTVFTADAGVDVWTLSPANRSVLIQNVRFQATGAGRALVGAGGAGAAGAFLSNGLKLENVDITTGGAATDALNITEANEVVLFNVQAPTPSSSFLTCSNVRLRGNTNLGNVQHTWDNTDANKPAAQSVGLQIGAGCAIGAWSGTGQPLVNGLVGSTIGLGIGTSMTGLNLSVSTIAPSIQIHGTVGAVDFASTGAKSLPDGAAAAVTVDFSGAVLIGTGYQFADVANVTNQAINFTGVRTSAAVTITSGLRCVMDERGSAFAVQPTYVSSGATLGSHRPPKFVTIGTAAIAATVVAFGFTVDTNYMVSAIESAAAGTPVTQGAKTGTQFTINIGGAPAGTLDTLVTWL